MTIKLIKENDFDFSKSESYLKRQQDVDVILALTNLLQLNVGEDITRKALVKVSNIIDKI